MALRPTLVPDFHFRFFFIIVKRRSFYLSFFSSLSISLICFAFVLLSLAFSITRCPNSNLLSSCNYHQSYFSCISAIICMSRTRRHTSPITTQTEILSPYQQIRPHSGAFHKVLQSFKFAHSLYNPSRF